MGSVKEETMNEQGQDRQDLDEFEEPDLMTVVAEDGSTLAAVVLAVVEHEGQDYAMLATEAQLQEENEENLDVYLFVYARDEAGKRIFLPIEDDALYAQLVEFCSTLMDIEP